MNEAEAPDLTTDNVVQGPFRAERNPISMWWRLTVSPEHVQEMFAQAHIGENGRPTRARVPDLDACRRLSEILSSMKVKAEVVPLSLDPEADRWLAGAEAALGATLAVLDRYADTARPGFRLAADLRQICEVAARLRQDHAPWQAATWHTQARQIAHYAQQAWATVGKPPQAIKETGPLVRFVHLALAAIGMHCSLAAVCMALRGERGPRCRER